MLKRKGKLWLNKFDTAKVQENFIEEVHELLFLSFIHLWLIKTVQTTIFLSKGGDKIFSIDPFTIIQKNTIQKFISMY